MFSGKGLLGKAMKQGRFSTQKLGFPNFSFQLRNMVLAILLDKLLELWEWVEDMEEGNTEPGKLQVAMEVWMEIIVMTL